MTPPEGSAWAIIALGMVGADFQVVSPPELSAEVAAWGARFVRAAATADNGKPAPVRNERPVNP
jgi:hypothetical protein